MSSTNFNRYRLDAIFGGGDKFIEIYDEQDVPVYRIPLSACTVSPAKDGRISLDIPLFVSTIDFTIKGMRLVQRSVKGLFRKSTQYEPLCDFGLQLTHSHMMPGTTVQINRCDIEIK